MAGRLDGFCRESGSFWRQMRKDLSYCFFPWGLRGDHWSSLYSYFRDLVRGSPLTTDSSSLQENAGKLVLINVAEREVNRNFLPQRNRNRNQMEVQKMR